MVAAGFGAAGAGVGATAAGAADAVEAAAGAEAAGVCEKEVVGKERTAKRDAAAARARRSSFSKTVPLGIEMIRSSAPLAFALRTLPREFERAEV